ncbi:hypothetical protein KCV87_28575 [Actinosynnema pretiosum subsp. pretiosum]|uniref:Hydrolytic protein n=1 Tax=Actinosynnema pretiosum subsp. pretiosum TaxID=103721 RepID=A0AA45L4K5_9PSEU|nr:hydrolytic protein [Actinosynnema pretiosum subsp. pretiosum]QUF03329.1 hypothetical protein KCV87_28575 [Actinosynnema pretiosum subsp. pretiosum]
MGATATLSAPALSAEPGQQVECTVVVRNTGGLVDQFTVDVVGDTAEWAVAEPAEVNLVPDQTAEVVVRFTPPRSSAVHAGVRPFGVRVTSREDPYGSVVEEGTVEVGAFTALHAELVPTKKEGARRARYEVAVDNTGNAPLALRVEPLDPEDELVLTATPRELVLPPGTTAFAKVLVKPHDTFLRGQPVRRPFRIDVVPAEGDKIAVDGVLVQRQVLPRWLLPALAALLALALLLATLWFTLLKPMVSSAAREAAEKQAEEVKAVAQEAQAGAAAAQAGADEAKQNSEKVLEAVGIDPSTVLAPGSSSGGDAAVALPQRSTAQAPPPAEPTDFRVAADSPITGDAGRFSDFTHTPKDDKKTLAITDLIVQNPRGDAGTVRLLRESNGARSTLLVLGLANFRDQDYHYVQPLRFKPGEKLVLSVSCQNPAERGNCTPSVSFSGRVEG